jgi:hypothetical protein
MRLDGDDASDFRLHGVRRAKAHRNTEQRATFA